MQVHQLYISLGNSIFPDKARESTAALLDSFQPGLVSRLMNYEITSSGEHRTITGFPPVHFASFKRGFSLVGFGEVGGAILKDAAAPLVQALAQERKHPVTIESRTIPLSVEWRPYSLRYCVPRMVVQKTKEHLAAVGNPEAGKAHIERLFLASLRRQADFVGLQIPDAAKVTLIGAEGEFAARNTANQYRLGLRGVVFDVNLSLGGLWSVGYLLSKGYGLFNADMQRASINRGASHAVPE